MPNQQKANDTKLSLKNKVALGVNPFDGDHAGNVADGTEDSIKVFLIEDFHRDLYLALVLSRDDRPSVSNTGFDIGDRIGDAGEHSGAVLGRYKDPDRLDLVLIALRPIYVDDSLFVDHQLSDVLASFVMDDNSLSERNVSDDILTTKRITASRSGRKQIVDALYDNGVLAKADQFLDRLHAALDPCFLPLFRIELGELVRTQELREHISR